MALFQPALELVLKHEGGYVDNPLDEGGPTHMGITIATLARVRGISVTKEDVKRLSLDDVAGIYRTQYWEPSQIALIQSQSLADVIYDQTILCGQHQAIKRCQIALKRLHCDITITGKPDLKTINSINSVDPQVFGTEFIIKTQDYLSNIVIINPKQIVFIRGWLRRTHDLLRHLLEL